MAINGSKWVSGRKGPEIAKLIRTEIRQACKTDGVLKGCKVSVRYEPATHRKSIDIEIQAAPVNVCNAVRVKAEKADPHGFRREERFSTAGAAILAECKRIADQYNRFDSDPSSDYNNDDFFCRVEFDWTLVKAHSDQILNEVHPACCGCAECEVALAA